MKFRFLFVAWMLSKLTLAQVPDWGLIFPQDEVTKMYITIPSDSLNLMLSDPYLGNGHEFPAAFRYVSNGLIDTVDVVGIRTRGNTSLQAGKKSFKLDFSVPGSVGKWNGFRELNLNGSHNDPSMMRAKIVWDIIRHFELPGSRVSFTELYINDEYKGLYSNVEFIDDQFTKHYFQEKTGNRWKCLYPATLEYLGPNGSAYQVNTSWGTPIYGLENNTQLNDYQSLADFINCLNNNNSADFACALRKIFDVDRFLQYLAIDIVTGNWDGGSFNKNNFYIYQNDNTHRLEYIPYDLDNTLGVDWFNINWATQNIYNFDGDNNLILYQRMINTPEFKGLLSYYIQQVSQYVVSNEFTTHLQQMLSMITPSALADTYRTLDYGFNDNDFLNSLNVAWGNHVTYGILPYFNLRSSSALQQLSNTITPTLAHSFRSFQHNDTLTVQFMAPVAINGFGYRWEAESIWIPATPIMVYDGIQDNLFQYDLPLQSYNGSLIFQTSINSINPNPCQSYWIHVGLDSLGLFVNELSPAGTNSAADESGLHEDWIELYKEQGSMVNWNDIWITDDANDPNKWKFKNVSSSIGPFLLLFADDQPNEGYKHVSFSLNNVSEFVGVSYVDQGEWHWLDSISYSNVPANASFGRAVDAQVPWINFSTATPNASNSKVIGITENALYNFVYPNPTSEILYFSKSNFVKVLNSTGGEVLSLRNVASIDVRHLSNGLYILQTENGHWSFIKSD